MYVQDLVGEAKHQPIGGEAIAYRYVVASRAENNNNNNNDVIKMQFLPKGTYI
jgi:hypothetical protein